MGSKLTLKILVRFFSLNQYVLIDQGLFSLLELKGKSRLTLAFVLQPSHLLPFYFDFHP